MCEVFDEKIQKRLLSEDMSLEEFLKMAQAMELATADVAHIKKKIRRTHSSLAYTGLKKYLFSTSIFYRRTFYSRDAVEMVLPFFHMKKTSAVKKIGCLRGRSQGPLGSTRLESYVIVVAFTSLRLQVVDSTPFFSLQIALLQG